MSLKNRINKGGAWFAVLGGIIGVLFIVFGGSFSTNTKKSEKNSSQEYYDVSFYTEALERKIETLCTSIAGITEAEVLLTLDCSTEYVYAQNIRQSENGESTSYSTDFLILDSDEKDSTALILEIYPKIRGIAVVCTGGDEIVTKQKIVDLLSAAFGISSNRIKVAGS